MGKGHLMGNSYSRRKIAGMCQADVPFRQAEILRYLRRRAMQQQYGTFGGGVNADLDFNPLHVTDAGSQALATASLAAMRAARRWGWSPQSSRSPGVKNRSKNRSPNRCILLAIRSFSIMSIPHRSMFFSLLMKKLTLNYRQFIISFS